jgi:hypothetical protein
LVRRRFLLFGIYFDKIIWFCGPVKRWLKSTGRGFESQERRQASVRLVGKGATP